MRYHFSGIAGAGMNPLAQLMRARGHTVQGSDRAFDQGKKLAIARGSAALGIALVPQDGSAISAGLDRFVYSTAVEAETPEMRAARALGLECVPRPALLAEVVDAGRPGVAIAGTSGKSTMTGMVGWLSREAGVPPRCWAARRWWARAAAAASCRARPTDPRSPRRASRTAPSPAIARRSASSTT